MVSVTFLLPPTSILDIKEPWLSFDCIRSSLSHSVADSLLASFRLPHFFFAQRRLFYHPLSPHTLQLHYDHHHRRVGRGTRTAAIGLVRWVRPCGSPLTFSPPPMHNLVFLGLHPYSRTPPTLKHPRSRYERLQLVPLLHRCGCSLLEPAQGKSLWHP